MKLSQALVITLNEDERKVLEGELDALWALCEDSCIDEEYPRLYELYQAL